MAKPKKPKVVFVKPPQLPEVPPQVLQQLQVINQIFGADMAKHFLAKHLAQNTSKELIVDAEGQDPSGTWKYGQIIADSMKKHET